MSKLLIKISLVVLSPILAVGSTIVLYCMAALILSSVPANTSFEEPEISPVTIYLLTNGVHTDIVLPVKNEFKDWSDMIACTQIQTSINDSTHISFGWGDKQFYMETPTWSDLRVITAFRALFFLGTGAMHITVHDGIQTGETCIAVLVSSEQYQQIAAYIENSFQQDGAGNVILIPNVSYSPFDCFYDARGTFSLFYTCNTWANECLKQSGLRAAVWTPFDKGIFYHYQNGNKQ